MQVRQKREGGAKGLSSGQLANWMIGLPLVKAALLALGGSIVLTSPAWAQTDILQAVLASPQKTSEVPTEEFRNILVNGSATVVDARPFMEFAIGRIPGAVNVSTKSGVPMSLYVSDVKEVERLVGGNRTAPLILYCNG